MAETIKVLVSEEVNERIKTLGKQISENYAGKQIHMICVLKGGVFFMCELAKRISVPVSLDFMCVSAATGMRQHPAVLSELQRIWMNPSREKMF